MCPGYRRTRCRRSRPGRPAIRRCRPQLESTFTNLWLNSDGVFLEIYEGNTLAAISNGLPSGRTLGNWDNLLHARRRSFFPDIPDPFPLTHHHTFTRTDPNSSAPQLLHYVNGANCSTNHSAIAILPDLSFREIRRDPGGSVRLILAVASAGQVRVEYSDNLRQWHQLETRATPGRSHEVFTDTSAVGNARFYRAISR